MGAAESQDELALRSNPWLGQDGGQSLKKAKQNAECVRLRVK